MINRLGNGGFISLHPEKKISPLAKLSWKYTTSTLKNIFAIRKSISKNIHIIYKNIQVHMNDRLDLVNVDFCIVSCKFSYVADY